MSEYFKKIMGWMHQFEFDYLKDNYKEIHDVLADLSFLPEQCDGSIGGIMFALSLDDEQRIKMASLWGVTFIEQAKKRIPHLKYLKEDFFARKQLEIKDMYLDSLIEMSEKTAERDMQKYINDKTFVDMKIKEFIDVAISLGVTENARHKDVIYHLFKKFNYEKRYGHTNKTDSYQIQRDTIEKRYYRIIDKDYLPTVFNIEIPPKV